MARPNNIDIMKMNMQPPTRLEVKEINRRLRSIEANPVTYGAMWQICKPQPKGWHYQAKVILWMMRNACGAKDGDEGE